MAIISMDLFDNYLFDFLRDLPQTDILQLRNIVNKVSLQKNDVYLAEGDYTNKLFYVKKGLLRGYFSDESGEEKTIFFRWQKEFGADPKCFFEDEPARYTWVALENTDLLEINHKLLEEISKRNMGLMKMRLKMQKKLLKRLSERLEAFVLYSPEERFLKMLEIDQHLFDRIPDKYLASFLGITPVSLSRIKKRISVN